VQGPLRSRNGESPGKEKQNCFISACGCCRFFGLIERCWDVHKLVVRICTYSPKIVVSLWDSSVFYRYA